MPTLTLEDILTDIVATIGERRLVDPELDEICRDFEALAMETHEIQNIPEKPRHVNDLR